MAKGTLTALIVIVIIVIAIVLMVLLRSSYAQPTSDFGTWSTFDTTLCLNENQGCGVAGTSQRFRTCTPNERTGNGCINLAGVHTFKKEVEDVECSVVCFTSQWDNITSVPCSVYDDAQGTMLAPSQTCRNPDQFTLRKITRECVSKDNTGTNACVKNDGSIAAVGEVETLLIPCNDIDDCFQGEWGICPPPGVTVSEDCGGTAAQCGVILADSADAPCFQEIGGEQVSVDPINCFPPDDPGPCPRQCFNFPCASYPTGYSNIADLLSDGSMNVFVELWDDTSGDYICADWAAGQEADSISQVPILGTTPTPGYLDVAIINGGTPVRFRIIPSQANAANGAFYLAAHVPNSGELGIVTWTGSVLRIIEFDLPGAIGDSLDDVPGLDLFQFTEASDPWILNHYVPGMTPTVTDIYCSGTPCLNATLCTEPWANVDDVCV